MNIIVRLTQTGFATATAALLVGCASVNTQPSGFLSNYEDLKPTKPGKKTLVYSAPAATHYHAVIIEPVCFQTNAAAKLSPKRQTQLSESLTRDTQKTFSERYEIATEPAPGVLRLRLTVSDINRSSPVLNLVTTAAAYAPLDMGAVAVEMEAVDSVSGQRVAALAAKRQGMPMSPAGFFASFSSTGHVKTGFHNLAKAMLAALSAPQDKLAAASIPAS